MDPNAPLPHAYAYATEQGSDAETAPAASAGDGWDLVSGQNDDVAAGPAAGSSPVGGAVGDGQNDAVDAAAAGGSPAPAKRTRLWPKLVAAAAVAGLVASLATAGLLGAFKPKTSPGTLQGLGQNTGAAQISGTINATDWQSVVNAVADSVVAIQTTNTRGRGAGSGVIVTTDGTIITNAHVIAAGGPITVTLSDGRIFEAEVTGVDVTTDLAVIRLTDGPADLVAATLGDSNQVTVGQPVLAIGNPLGLAGTATTGIVSAVNRPVTTGTGPADTIVTNAIQIDAAINPGNSGGPLFNTNGQVIGITSSIATLSMNQLQQSGSIGLGFAIPSNVADNISSQLIQNGVAAHGFLGVLPGDTTVTADGQTRKAAVVNSFSDNSPAEAAGLQVGDAIVAVDGVLTPSAESLSGLIRTLVPGAQVQLTVVRDGTVLTISVTLGTRPTT